MPTRALEPCPPTANCVSTDAVRSSQRMAPVPFTDAPSEAFARAGAAILAEPRTRVVSEGRYWLKAESRSLVFRFVDDIDVIIDEEARVIRFRSAARRGKSDLGVNRRRMERFSKRLQQSTA